MIAHNLNKKTLSLNEIQECYKIQKYEELVKLINKLTDKDALKPIKASGTNFMTPPLYNKYRLTPKKEDYSHLLTEINYDFPLEFSRDYYYNNPKKYEEDRLYIRALIDYFRNKKLKLDIPMSINERSFDIWGREKFLKEGAGQTVLKNLGLSLDKLNIYLTPEPFVYFSINKENNQSILIIENKDTWYTIRKFMLQGQSSFLGEKIGTIIYGCGKNIEKSLEEYNSTVETYLLNPERLLYWGDIDYEGILIYERLKKRYCNQFNIVLFRKAYITMLELSKNKDLPKCSEKQIKGNLDTALSELSPLDTQIISVLNNGDFIPQEIINYAVLREG